MPREINIMPRLSVRNFVNCLVFNGSTAKVKVQDGALLGGQTNYSISAWVKNARTASSGRYAIYSERTGGNNLLKFELGYGGGNTVLSAGEFRDDAGTIIQPAGSSTIMTDNEWHHVVLVKAATNLKTYIDGNVDINTTFTPTDNFTNASIQCWIGFDHVDNAFLQGNLDEVVIYAGYALSQAEVRNILTYGSYPSQAMTRYFKFDEGSGTVATDSSTNAIAGVITSPTYSSSVKFTGRTLVP